MKFGSRVRTWRWLLVIPSGIAGVLLGFAATIAFIGVADRLCPLELRVSGLCTASWYRYAESAAFCGGAALGEHEHRS